MRKLMLALAASTALVSPVPADPNIPVAAPENPNMRTIAYNPRARVQIVGNLNRATAITFARNEEVIRVLLGDGGSPDQAWEGPSQDEVQNSPLENVVYLYPKNEGYTSVTIITKGPKGQRVYQFGALARKVPPCIGQKMATGNSAQVSVCDDSEATYGLAFTYPEDDAQERAEKAVREAEARRAKWEADAPLRQARAEMLQNASMRGRLTVDPFVGGACRNWRYEGQANDAARTIWPVEKLRVTDNGQQTAFVFEGNLPVPAFYLLGPDGHTETPISTSSRGPDTFVIDAVAPARVAGAENLRGDLRLRLDDAVIFMDRVGDLPASCVSKTGTTSPDVARVLRRTASAAAPR